MIFASLFFQDLPPLRVAEVKKPNGALSLELRAPCKKELEEGFWSFLDQFGFRTKGSSHSRCLLPKEVLLLHKALFLLQKPPCKRGGYGVQNLRNFLL